MIPAVQELQAAFQARGYVADDALATALRLVVGLGVENLVVVETDDNVTDNDDNATGQTLGSTYKKFEIDFGKGLSDIRFLIDGQPVGSETFSLAGVTSGQNVQPFVQIQKASGTGVPAITIAQVGWQSRYNYGA